MPTDTKNRTAKASRNGSASAAACWLTGDCPTTIPARNAPSAMDAPKKTAAPVAIAMASARIVSVNSSRDRRRATFTSIQGTIRDPTRNTRATSAPSFPRATRSETNRPREAAAGSAAWPRTGITTRTITVRTSSTMSQPMAAWPAGVPARLCVSSPRSSTTVLATESAMPRTRPAFSGQPNQTPMAKPDSVATALWSKAPGMAIPFTSMRSSRWKWSPTPNISKTTPISASWLASLASPTKPGVKGPMATPASRYPTIGETRILWASTPSSQAAAKAAAMVVTSGLS